jgi:hypothetical protein
MAISPDIGLLHDSLSSQFGNDVEWRVVSKSNRLRGETWQLEVLTESPSTAVSTVYVDFEQNKSEQRIQVWLWPDDPAIPAIKMFMFEESARNVLEALVGSFDGAKVELQSYRPLRRGVFKVSTENDIMWVKVVKPAKVQDALKLHELHRLASPQSPKIIAWSELGVVVSENAVGTPAHGLQDLAEIEKALLALRTYRFQLNQLKNLKASKPFASQNLDHFLTVLNRVHRGIRPEIGFRLEKFQKEALEDESLRIPSNVHGDLHLGQMFWDSQSSDLEIIDVDNLGKNELHREIGSFLSSLYFQREYLDFEHANLWLSASLKTMIDDIASIKLLKFEIASSFIARISSLQNLDESKAMRVLDEIRGI